jgi:glycosyltransferase involved in cell wall biosynthesis
MSNKPIQVLLFAPGNEILGGQTVQAYRLLDLLGSVPGIEMRFQPINPLFPPGLRWLKRVPFVRTCMTMLCYLPRVLWKVPQADIVHAFCAGFYSYTLWTIPAIAIGKLFGKKVIVNYRDGQVEQHLRTFRSAKPTLAWADRIVGNTGFISDVLSKFGLQADTIFNVIDTEKYIYRKRSKLRPRIMTNRFLEPLYNVECILRAFQRVLKKYPDAELTIAHDGPLLEHLRAFASNLGVMKNCHFIGRVPMDKIPQLCDEAEIYVTTPNIDCMPNSLLECMASGLPIVATDTGGIPYMVTNEKTALLVKLDDDEAVARNIVRLLEDPGLVERLTAEARREVERYRPEQVRDQWVGLYRRLLGD